MRRFGFALLLMCSVIGLAGAQISKPDGYLRATFGHVRGPNGAVISTKGMLFPYTIHKISSTRILPGTTFTGNRSFPPPPPSNTMVYQSDAGSGYGYIEPGASCLDDLVTLPSGPGLPWQQLTFGLHSDDNHQFLVRWIVYDTYTTGGEPTAFSNVVADFGGILPGYAAGDYELTVDVSPAGVVMDSATIYVAQQFRTPQPDGNGPFDDAYGSEFNPTAPPQIGSSTNIFWYDQFDTGYYDDNMQDYFGDTSFANFLFAILVGGSQTTVVPYTYTLDNGAFISGDVTSLWYTDQNYLVLQQRVYPTIATPNLRVEVEGLASSTVATSLTFSMVASATSTGGSQKIDLWNYSTNAWDLVDTEPIATTDTPYNITITSNPSRYVNQSTKHVKARISYFRNVPAALNWDAKLDKTNWIITHP